MKYLIGLFDITRFHRRGKYTEIAERYSSNALDIENIRRDFTLAKKYVIGTRK